MPCLVLVVITELTETQLLNATKFPPENAVCTMPQQLLIDDTLHIEAKQISFSTSETFAYMGFKGFSQYFLPFAGG